MGNPTEHIERAIAGLEAERDRIVKAITALRTTLATMTNGASAVASEGNGKKGFQRKYDLNARGLILRVGRTNRTPLTIGQIAEILKTQGYEFKKTTVGVNVRHLWDDNEIRRVKAPKGSGYTHAYVFPPPVSSTEATEDQG